MEPGCTLPEAPPYQPLPDGLDDIIALEITEVSPDLVVLQLKEDTPEGCGVEAYRDDGDGGEQGPVFIWEAMQRDDYSTQWRPPGATPVQSLTDGQIGEYCGMTVNSVAEEMYATYTIPETCFGNLELQFYPCDICEASFTDEQELERHVSDSHFISGAKRNELRGKAPSLICKEGGAPGQTPPFGLGLSQPKVPMRKTQSPPLQCVVCGRTFKQLKCLQRHMWYHTWRQGPSNSVSDEKQQPVTTVTQNPCPKCGRTFKERKMLDRHRRIYHHNQTVVLHRGRHHPDLLKNVSPLRCCECDRHFGTKETFYKHQCFHLRKQLRAFNASGRKSHGVNFYHCQLCALPFTGGLEFEHHIKVTHPEQYRKATRRIFSAGMTRSKRSQALKHRDKTVSLENAEAGFPPQTADPDEIPAITEQQDSEPVQLSYPCPECGKSFHMQALLNRHQKMYHIKAETRLHNGNNSYAHHKCPKCEKTFRTRRMLQKHKWMHRKKKDLTCCECRRCFGAAETFYKHKCFHLRKQLRAFNASGRKSHGVNFYHCQLCAIPFTGGLEFEHHIKVTHPEQYRKATRRIFSAGMTRSKRSRALKHRDKTVSLEGAEAGFPPQTADPDEIPAITEQQDSEPVQLSYPCPECGKSFHMQALLNRHQKMYHIKAETWLHNGNNSYAHHKCTKCEKTFRTRRMLEKHKQMHHKKKALTTRVKSEVEDKCAQTGDTRGSCSVAANTEEQGSGTSDLLHQCSKCGRIFQVRKMLDKHQRIYHRDQSAVLRRSRSHPTVSLLRCCECDRHFSTTESFHRHQCFHLRKQLRAFNASGRKSKGVNFFHCQLCTLQFTEGLKFELHVKVTHPEQYKKAARTRCSAGKTTNTGESRDGNNGKTYSKPPSVAKAHVKITRVKSEVEDKCAQTGVTRGSCSVATNIEEQGSGTSDLLHQCSKCGRIFQVRKMLDKHQRIYHRDQSAVLRRSRSHPTVSLLRCCECDRHFSTTESFHRHQCFHLRKQLRAFNASGRKSKGVNFFHCQLCTLQFTEGLKFELHVKVTHPEQYKKAARTRCSAGKTTKTGESGVVHNIKTYSKPPSVAKAHVKITRVKSEVEDKCAQTGTTRDSCSVTANIEEQGSGTSDLLHQCGECGRIFKVRKMLDKHQRIYHRDHSAVLRRSRSHPTVSLLRCCECDRHFSTTESFHRHQCFHLRKQLRAFNASGRKSKGVNFFHCQLCTLQFTKGLKFELHVKVTHPEQYKKAARNKCSDGTSTKR
ncbi:hypothetical protein ANANG_G00249210 [Anguilla anguilla]|uniref:C2H2-type domain-containing protein n=1 Tax=Anguilla anguilla TaxID=7936 RepID=A0A9D3M072_ANGAN|nr:hypothetical protein ANANG_G00249210 [Anguilla anguilla]